MKVKIELTIDEIETALKRYVSDKVGMSDYHPDDVQFAYEGQEDPDAYAYQIEGAFVTLELGQSQPELKLIPPAAESLAPEGWRSV